MGGAIILALNLRTLLYQTNKAGFITHIAFPVIMCSGVPEPPIPTLVPLKGYGGDILLTF